MTVNWAAAFSGTVTVSVRTTGCGNPSDYYNVSIDVIPETIPSTTSSGVTKPDAFNLFLCDGRRTGTIPNCETTINTHPTQFFSTVEAGSPNNYGSLNWQIIDLPGGSTQETNPGTIDSRGVVRWNKDYWGKFQIQVTPVSCDSSTGTPVLSDVFEIGEKNEQLALIAPIGGDSTLPSCPIPAGVTTTTLKNFANFPVKWIVSDLNALSGTNTVTSIFERSIEPDAGTNSTTLTLYWAPGFSGTLIVSAEAIDCPGVRRHYPIIIPEAANIELVPGTGSDNQLICAGDQIDDIEYHLLGAATDVISVTLMNLPDGVIPLRTDFIQTTVMSLTTNTLGDGVGTEAGKTYITTIDGVDYPYVVNPFDALDDIGLGVRNSISAVISATYNADTDRLIVEGDLPGKRFSITVSEPFQNAINFGTVSSTEVITKITLRGTPSDQASGTYNYTISTIQDENCTADTVGGLIEIAPKSTITLISGSSSATVCDDAAMTPVEFQIGNALSADVLDSDLPNGVLIHLQVEFLPFQNTKY